MEPDLERRFLMCVHVCADSVARLRRCDVWRLMDTARGALSDDEMRQFLKWIYPQVGQAHRAELAEWLAEEFPQIRGDP
jgi:hypothetical protein